MIKTKGTFNEPSVREAKVVIGIELKITHLNN